MTIFQQNNAEGELTTYFRFPKFSGNEVGYITAGSDGTVVLEGVQSSQSIVTAQDGTSYEVMGISAAQNVQIRVNDPNGSLLNGNSDAEAPNVTAGEKATVIAAGGAGSIGTQTKPLNIEAKQVVFLNADGEQVIEKDTYIYIDQGDTSLDGDIIVDGVIWELKTADGSVTASDKNLIVRNGGIATIKTNVAENAASAGNVALKTITVEKSLNGKQTSLTMDVAGDVLTGMLTVAEGSKADIEADGMVSVNTTETESGDLSVTGGSTLDVSAQEGISVSGSQTVTGSKLTETSTAGAIAVTGNETISENSTVTKEAYSDITVGGSQTVTGSTLTETSTNGAIAVAGDEQITDSTVTKNANGNITVGGSQTVTGSILTETSTNGDISVAGNATLTDSTAKLTANQNLTVGGNTVVTGGKLTAEATEGDIALTKLRTLNTTTGFTAGADMRFDDWMSEKSYNTVAVGGTFGMRENGGTSFDSYEAGYGNRAFIKYADTDNNTNALLSISAGNVGETSNRLVVDIPAELTMQMPQVGNVYIDALELVLADSDSYDPNSGTYNRVWLSQTDDLLDGYFVTTLDNPKINEFTARDPATGEETMQGDRLDHIVDKTVGTEFEIPAAEDLADRFLGAKGELNGILNAAAVQTMIGAELDSKVLSEIIPDEQRETLMNQLGMLDGLTEQQKQELLAPEQAQKVLESILQSETYDAEQIYSAMLATDEAGQKKLFALLMDAQLSGQTEGKPFTDLDQLINDLLTDEEREELYKQAIRENSIPEEADPNNTGDTDPRAFHVEIGVSTGNTTIYNDGDIEITVNGDSDLTAENIQSERGDVSVEVQNGSILSAGAGANITGENVSLSASENIGTQEKPVNVEQVEEEPNVTVTVIGKGVAHSETITDPEGNEKTIWVMDVELRYDWARTDDAEATKRLDAEAANGDIFLAEQTGNTGLGILTGAGTVSVLTPGSIADVRTDAEKAAGTPNITTENAIVISEDGSIGTEEQPISVNIGEHMKASAEGDVNITTTENLSITADSQTGELNIEGQKDLTVDNTQSSADGTGNMNIGNIAAGGTASVTAKGDMLASDGSSLVSGDSIALNAGGGIGTAQQPLRVDTAAGSTGSGSLTAIGGADVTVEEINGDLAIDSVVSGGNANITADGSITDTNGNAIADAADSQKKADDAKNLADEAQSEADVLDEYAAGIEKVAADKEKLAKEAAERAEEIQQKIDDALAKNPDANVNALLNQLKLAQAAADKAQEIADQAKAEAKAQRAIADEAAEKAQMLNDAAKAAQDAADAALEKANAEDPSIKTGGDLNLTAGGTIGTGSNALDTEVGGKTNVSAEGDVNLSERGDMHIGTITNPEDAKLALDSTGGITSDSVISGDDLDINALGGDVQVETDVNSISGAVSGDAQISNSGDLRVDDLTVKGQLDLSADGAITAGTKADGTANITAGNLTITVPANKDIGTEVNPLIVDADRITADGRDIYINFLKDVTIDHIEGEKVDISVNGDVLAGNGRPEHIRADDLEMDVLGNIGTAKKPLLIYVPGRANIQTQFGTIYVRNLYTTGENAISFGNIVSDVNFRFVPYAFMTLRPVELHDSILTLKEVGGSRMVDIRGSGLDAVQGNVLYIWALDEDGVSVTNELRHLHLNAGTVRMMIALGYEWLMFQTGDSVVMIHLTELEDGSYIITVDPQNADCPVCVTLDDAELTQLPESMILSEIAAALEPVSCSAL